MTGNPASSFTASYHPTARNAADKTAERDIVDFSPPAPTRCLPTAGPTLRALAALRDMRALRVVRWALEQANVPGDIGPVVRCFGPAGAELIPVIRRRLLDLPTVDGHDRRRYGLVVALGRIGEAAAAAVPELLALPPEPVVLTALGQIGPGAADAIPLLRRLLDHGEPTVEIAAASALWRIDGDSAPVLPVLTRQLDGDQPAVRGAAETLADLGPAGAATAPRLRDLVRDPAVPTWLRLHAAAALWRATGDVDATLPVLFVAWSADLNTRVHVARCVAEMGPAAAAAGPLLHEELGQRRRHTARAHSWSTDRVDADLELLRACNAALAALGPRPGWDDARSNAAGEPGAGHR